MVNQQPNSCDYEVHLDMSEFSIGNECVVATMGKSDEAIVPEVPFETCSMDASLYDTTAGNMLQESDAEVSMNLKSILPSSLHQSVEQNVQTAQEVEMIFPQTEDVYANFIENEQIIDKTHESMPTKYIMPEEAMNVCAEEVETHNGMESHYIQPPQDLYYCSNVWFEETPYSTESDSNLVTPQMTIKRSKGPKMLKLNKQPVRVKKAKKNFAVPTKLAASNNVPQPTTSKQEAMIKPIAHFVVDNQGILQQVTEVEQPIPQPQKPINTLLAELEPMLKFKTGPQPINTSANQKTKCDVKRKNMPQAPEKIAVKQNDPTTQQDSRVSKYWILEGGQKIKLDRDDIEAALCRGPNEKIEKALNLANGALVVKINNGRQYLIKFKNTQNEKVKKLTYIPIKQMNTPPGIENPSNTVTNIACPSTSHGENILMRNQLNTKDAPCGSTSSRMIVVPMSSTMQERRVQPAVKASYISTMPSNVTTAPHIQTAIPAKRRRIQIPMNKMYVQNLGTPFEMAYPPETATIDNGSYSNEEKWEEAKEEGNEQENLIIIQGTRDEGNGFTAQENPSTSAECYNQSAEIIRFIVTEEDQDIQQIPVTSKSNAKKKKSPEILKKCFTPRRKSSAVRKPRTTFTPTQLQGLLDAFEQYMDPKPHLDRLSHELNLSHQVIEVWYMNYKSKLKRELDEEIQMYGLTPEREAERIRLKERERQRRKRKSVPAS